MEITDEQRRMIRQLRREHRGFRHALGAILTPEQYVVAQYMYGGDESLTDLKERLQQANFDIELKNNEFLKKAKLPENWFGKEADEFLKQCMEVIPDAIETVKKVVQEKDITIHYRSQEKKRTIEDVLEGIKGQEYRRKGNMANPSSLEEKKNPKLNSNIANMTATQIKNAYELGVINIDEVSKNIGIITKKILLTKNAITYVEFFTGELLENNDPISTTRFINSIKDTASGSTTTTIGLKGEESINLIKQKADDMIIQMNRDWVKEKIKNGDSTESIVREFANLPDERRNCMRVINAR